MPKRRPSSVGVPEETLVASHRYAGGGGYRLLARGPLYAPQIEALIAYLQHCLTSGLLAQQLPITQGFPMQQAPASVVEQLPMFPVPAQPKEVP